MSAGRHAPLLDVDLDIDIEEGPEEATASGPQVVYALVLDATSREVVAEHAARTGNFQQVALDTLARLHPSQELRSYESGEFALHIIAEGPIGQWYVCAADKRMGRRLPLAFLAALQEEFETPKLVAAHGAREAMEASMRDLMESYNAPSADLLAHLQEKMQHISDGIMESIDKLLERRDQNEVLVVRSEELASSASLLALQADRLGGGRHARRQKWWYATAGFALTGVGIGMTAMMYL